MSEATQKASITKGKESEITIKYSISYFSINKFYSCDFSHINDNQLFTLYFKIRKRPLDIRVFYA